MADVVSIAELRRLAHSFTAEAEEPADAIDAVPVWVMWLAILAVNLALWAGIIAMGFGLYNLIRAVLH